MAEARVDILGEVDLEFIVAVVHHRSPFLDRRPQVAVNVASQRFIVQRLRDREVPPEFVSLLLIADFLRL